MAADDLVDELRRTITRLRSLLAESMEWGWASEPPPADVIARCETALGITDETPAPFPARSGRPRMRVAPEPDAVELESA